MSKQEAVYILIGVGMVGMVWFLVVERADDEPDCGCGQ